MRSQSRAEAFVRRLFCSVSLALICTTCSVGTVYAQCSAALSWTPPTENSDGSPLTDLAGYHAHWQCGSSPAQVANIVNPGATSYTVEGLTDGLCTFSVTAFNDAGVDSVHSNEATKTAGPGCGSGGSVELPGPVPDLYVDWFESPVAAPSIVQGVADTPSGTSVQLTDVVAGNAIVVLLSQPTAGARTYTVSDDQNGTYTLSEEAIEASGRRSFAAYFLNSAGGTINITASVEAFSEQSATYDVVEVADVDELDVDFIYYQGSSSVEPVYPGTSGGTTVADNSIAFFVSAANANPTSYTIAESGWTELRDDVQHLSAAKAQESSTSLTGEFSFDGTTRQVATVFFSLKAAAGGGGLAMAVARHHYMVMKR